MLNMRVALCSLLAMCAASVHAASWSRAYRGASGGIHDVVRASDGSLWIATQNGEGHHLVHVSPTGAILGVRMLPRGRDVFGLISANDGVFLVGSVKDDEWVAHIDKSFGVRWSTRFPGPARTSLIAGALLRDGGAVFAGQLQSSGLVMRFSPRGEIVWQKVYAGAAGTDYFESIAAARDGSLYVGGLSASRGWLLKLRSDGTIEWQRLNPRGGGVTAVRETAAGDVITACSAYIDNEIKAMVEKITPSGDAAWSMAVRSDMATFADDVALLPDGGFMLAGHTKDDRLYAARLTADGRATAQMAAARSRAENVYVAGTSDVVSLDELDEGTGGISVLIGLDPTDPPSSCIRGERVDWRFEPFQYEVTRRNVEVSDAEFTGTADSFAFANAKLTEEACARTAAPARGQMVQAPQSFLARYRALRAERNALIAEIKKLYLAKQFEELDKRAAAWRANREHNGPHYTKLEILYDTLGRDIARGSVPVSQLLAIADEWHAHNPQSPSPWIIKAYLLSREASLARQTAQEPEKMKTFAAAAREAERYAAGDPFTYVLLIWLAGSTGEGDIREIARRSAQAGPPLARVFIEGAGWLRMSDEHNAFLDEAARLTRTQYGEGLYADMGRDHLLRFLDAQAALDPAPRLFRELGLDWRRMQQGYRDLIARNPEWTPLYHRFASAAYYTEDRKLARELFARPELQWFDEVSEAAWSGLQWSAAKDWATAEVEEFMLTGRLPQILLRSDLTFRERSPANGLNAFVVQTQEGVIAVSVLPNRPQSPKQEALHSALQGWTLRNAATGTTTPVMVDGNVRRHASLRGVLVAPLTGSAAPAFALKARAQERRRRFVLVCEADPAGGCKQQLVAIQFVNEKYVAEEEGVDFASALGAPVIDADGYAIGVVTRSSGPTVQFEVLGRLTVRNGMVTHY